MKDLKLCSEPDPCDNSCDSVNAYANEEIRLTYCVESLPVDSDSVTFYFEPRECGEVSFAIEGTIDEPNNCVWVLWTPILAVWHDVQPRITDTSSDEHRLKSQPVEVLEPVGS